MASSLISEDALRRIGPLALQRYATSRGWQRIPLPERFHLALYRRPEDANKELVLPQLDSFADYFDRIVDFLSGLASFDGVPVRQVLNAVLNPHTDVLKYGYDAPETKLGYIPFLTGISLFDAALRSISTATYDALRPEKFHLRMSNPAADAYIESCRMGQTEVGSFVISCICPVEPASQLPVSADGDDIVEETPAFGRQVTQRIMYSLSQINEFMMADQMDRLVNPEPGDLTISGNFYESLLAFPVRHEAASLYVQANWDGSIPEPDAPKLAAVRYDMFEAIDDVARQLRPTRVSREDKFIAKVVTLKGEANPEDRMEGDAILLLLHRDEGLKAKIWLSADDYAQAARAHIENKYVTVTGVFSRFRKTNAFDSYSHFVVLDD